jgi:hypothetical protein
MSEEAIWRAFAETGEPVYYLLYRAAQEEKREREENAARGVIAAG